MKKKLSCVQEDIINTSGNVIVRASAGTGKTHIMVLKIQKDIEDNNSHKSIAAITFTIKAAGEIFDRLPSISEEHFIGTNNRFAVEEVIQPFMKDVYGTEYDIDMETDYETKVNSFNEGIKEIKKSGIIPIYEKKQKNFIFDLALRIMQNSYACREYIKAKYFKIYVDEYQDCDKDMHEFFMYLCDNLKIDFFIVGDPKQSLYIWRGAYPDSFESICKKENFIEKKMTENFRSCIAIQNYTNMLFEETRGFVREIEDVSAIRLIKTKLNDWPSVVLRELDLSKQTAVLRIKNDDAIEVSRLLSKNKQKFIYVSSPPICSIKTKDAWLYSAIAQFYIKDKYSIYSFIRDIPDEKIRFKDSKKILMPYLNNICNSIDDRNIKCFIKKVQALAEYLGYEVTVCNLIKLYYTVTTEKYRYYFFQDEIQNISMTVHSAKGLEFEQVVLFSKDYSLNSDEDFYRHYVAATRAKERLIIISINENRVYNKINQIALSMNRNIEDFIEIVEISNGTQIM
ncbi:UvrD-helicase domain-containing protein [Enterococcus cecorum]|uniref:UvrD-helicase domain-containing protein n=1 Tax=Enterococcus cecorum TaxID=44008 RepID=UPI0032C49756